MKPGSEHLAAQIHGWEFRIEDTALVGIYERTTGKRVGEVAMYDSDNGDSPPWRTGDPIWRWRFEIEGGSSGGAYMPREVPK